MTLKRVPRPLSVGSLQTAITVTRPAGAAVRRPQGRFDVAITAWRNARLAPPFVVHLPPTVVPQPAGDPACQRFHCELC